MKRLVLLACLIGTAWGQAADIRVDVNLVRVAATVIDRNGTFVKGLQASDFRLSDNGTPREIKYLWQETDLPLTVGLIADVSGSQAQFIARHRREISQFLEQVLGPRDQAFLVTAGTDVRLITDLTSSIEELREGVEHLDPRQRYGKQLGQPCRGKDAPQRRRRGCGGTALWNAVYASARLKMKPVTGRKALVVLTDGMDTGSFHHLTDAIEAAQGAETIVYTLHSFSVVTAAISPILAIALTKGNHDLNRLAEETGGKPFPSPRNGPAEIFAQIESELRNLYVLGFTPPDDAQDGTFHKLQLSAAQKGITVRSRRGYAAPSSTPSSK